MSPRWVVAGASAALLAAALVPAARAATTASFTPPPPARVTASTAAGGGPGFSARLMHFEVSVGPSRDTDCAIIGELFTPTAASAGNPVPAILTTNGFGGSYADQVTMARYFAPRGYVVLTYSGLGFGGSGCSIELDDPDWDGAAASQLISFLGDQPEILKDGPDDPRVGMIGGSYGGDVQFSTAAIDPRVDTLVPIITWNDLAYSLAPNNNAPNFVHSDVEPGAEKVDWASLFFADGMAGVPANLQTNGVPSPTCPGFDPAVCEAFANAAATGYTDPTTSAFLRHTSMVDYHQHLHLPVMLMQGEGDTLFNINEAVANYDELRAQGYPVKLVIQSWGHSDSTPAPGEVSYESTAQGYETLLIQDWFAKYLKHQDVNTGPGVEYFRDWVPYSAAGSAEAAYGTAPSWPVGSTLALYLSGNGDLVTNPASVVGGSETFANTVAGSYSETSGVQGTPPVSDIDPLDAPGTFASFETAPLASSLDSVGVPIVRFDLRTSIPAGLGPATDPVLFGKLYDVAPDGTKTLVQRLVSPIRVSSESHPIALTLPGVVHRYLAGHRIELVLAATDAAYMGSRVADVLTVTVDPAQPSILTLPVIAPTDELSGGPRATGA